MPRAPLQVLVIPFRNTDAGLEYAVFHRADEAIWQFIAGGGEDTETALMAAQREAAEEAGIAGARRWLELDARASIRRTEFAQTEHWPTTLYVVPEFAFGVEATGDTLCLSHEHDEVRWCTYAEAQALLGWDSNRTALWELNERLLPAGTVPSVG